MYLDYLHLNLVLNENKSNYNLAILDKKNLTNVNIKNYIFIHFNKYKFNKLNWDLNLFFRIVDEDHDTISKGIAQTKMSIRYFDVKESGMHTMIVTNLSQESMKYEIEIGSTDANKIIIPAGIMFVGGLLLLFTSFMKLKNYRTEQPDENIR